MGTRSLIHVKNWKGEIITTIYQQLDGYLSGVGKELKCFLNNKTIINGIEGDTSKVFNGMEDLAALLIKEFKKGVGGLYIYPSGSSGLGEEYVYTIYQVESRPINFNETSKIGIEVNDIFKGAIEDFDPEKLEADEYA